MAGPFIFISTHHIVDGKLEAFKENTKEVVKLVRDHEPQMLAFNIFFNEEETEVTGVQVHPDADSMLFHMGVVEKYITKTVDDMVVSKEMIIYGEPNDAVLGMIKQLSQAGIPLTVKPLYFDGITRLSGVSTGDKKD